MPYTSPCSRCGGELGAHYGACFLGRLLAPLLGSGYPMWKPDLPAVEIPAIDDLLEQVAYSPQSPPQRDDDYTDAAVDRELDGDDAYPDFGEEDDRAAALGQPAATTGTAPAPPESPVEKPAGRYAGKHVDPAAAERRAAADLFVAECVTAADDPADSVTSAQLAEAYDAWRPAIAGPPVHRTILGSAMRAAGYEAHLTTRAEAGPGGHRPTRYTGVRLKHAAAAADGDDQEGHPAPGSDLPAEHHAWIPASREACEPASAPTCLPVSGYTGKRPGREIPRRWRDELVEPLLEQGWEYRPTNARRRGKPRLLGPDGQWYSLPNTPSEHRGFLNARSQLRRMGAVL